MTNDGNDLHDQQHRQHSSFSCVVQGILVTSVLEPPTRPGLLGRIDDYEVVRLLGAGGMGLVFLAHSVEGRTSGGAKDADSSPTPVAIKVLKPELVHEPRAVTYFLREARHMQRLAHPHILGVLAVSPSTERPYFVTPYMPGGNLGTVLQPGRKPPGDFAFRIAKEVATALHFAHSRGILHRDVKPANILLDGSGRAALSDFGLARTVFNDTFMDFRGDSPEGTVTYLSPGVVAGEIEDMRSDIYSYGALLYELLSGSPPYAGESKEHVRKLVLAGPPPDIESLNPHASKVLVHVCRRAMARQLRDRYATMAEVLQDLESEDASGGASRCSATSWLSRRMGQRRSPIPPLGLSFAWSQNQRALLAVIAFAVVAAVGLWLQSHLPLSKERDGPLVGPPTPRGPKATASGLPSSQPDDLLTAQPPLPPSRSRYASPLSTSSRVEIVFGGALDIGDPLDLYLMGCDGHGLANLTEDLDWDAFGPKYSPDGTRIAFLTSAPRADILWVMNADGTGKRQVRAPADVNSPSWYDNETLYFAAGGFGWNSIYRINLDGSDEQAIIDDYIPGGANSSGGAAYSPVAGLLAFHAATPHCAPTRDIYLADAGGSNLRFLFTDADDDTDEICPVWSRDGRTVYWTRMAASGTPPASFYGVIVCKDLDSPVPLNEFDTTVRSWDGRQACVQAVSPDGGTLLFKRDEDAEGTGDELVIFEITTRCEQVLIRLARCAGADWRPTP